jgi:hypothetical protein
MAGILVFLGSLIYLFVVFTWYSTSAVVSSWWLPAGIALFWYPLVAALAIISTISLFFKGLKGMAGKLDTNGKHPILWKFTNIGGIAMLILTAGGPWFWWVMLGFVLTYLGAMFVSM